ncbi:vacuolar protein sorting-associated protein 54-like [Actinia tenebrosa]|uniref:Vacuolar protein sorting-associated protein 54-like n=1 Tax=Actinia tenebrosa TaxID=6105 RepID=A0A6P8H3T1_ACTTE|nr:vacuolar protein sorting-associated protein 54-like [Actinia tenebrosa]
MLRTADSNETSPWQSCGVCPDKRIFRFPKDFSAHLRQFHCTKEGGSFVCRYGRNGVCPSLPVDGVSDKDYESHVEKNHIRLDKAIELPSPREDLPFARPRIPPIVFKDTDNFTVYSSTQNLPAVLNDPRYNKRHADLFTRTWGEEFVPHPVPPLTLLHSVPFAYFEDYLKRIEMRLKLHHKLKKTLEPSLSTAQPGDTGFSAAALAAARRQSVQDRAGDINVIPKVFMQPGFSLENPETFQSVLPWSLVTAEPSKAEQDRAGLMNTTRNSAKLLQEKLSHYLDIVEMNLAYQISLRSEDFFSAMASQDQLQDHRPQSLLTFIRLKIKKVSEVLCQGNLEMLRLTALRSKYSTVYEKLKLMSTVHQTQPTIQLLLATSDFVGALDLISTTQEVLQQELAGIQSFSFIHLYRDEAYSTIKTSIKQTVQSVVASLKTGNEEESQSLNETMRGLDYEQWLRMLKEVFHASLDILHKMKILHKSIVSVLAIAAGNSQLKSSDDPDDYITENIREEAENLQLTCDVDVLITKSELNKLSQESKELLCAACEMAQVRCAKLINIRAKVCIHPRGKDPKFLLGTAQEVRATTTSHLMINGQKFPVVGTVLLLLKMVVEYCQCVDDTPMLATDIMNKLFEILKLFNSRTCQLVLGAGALQLVGLKTITVKQLALASRCLQVISIHIPVFKSHFEERLPPKQYVLLSQFDQIRKDYDNHQLELNGKIVGLMEEAFRSYLSQWEVKPPMPSQAMRSIVKKTVKLHESLSTISSSNQIEILFKEIKRVFKNCLAEKLEVLRVSNDGGPQHGLVTSDLAFFIESLRSLHGMRDIGKVLDDVWKAVNELRNAKNSPATGRKASLQK